MLIISIAIFIITLIFISKLAKRKVSFTKRNLISLLLAVIFGLFIFFVFPDKDAQQFIDLEYVIRTVSSTYVGLLKMMIIPIVFVSITTTIISISGKKGVIKRVGKIVGYFAITVSLAALISLVISAIFDFAAMGGLNNGEMANIADKVETVEGASLFKVIYDMTAHIPASIFAAFSDNNVIGTLIVSALIGMAVSKTRTKKPKLINPIVNGLEALKIIVNSMVIFIIKLTPYGVFALLSMAVATKGAAIFGDYAVFIGAAFLAMITIWLMHMLIIMIKGVNPLKFIKNIFPVLITGFSTQSSSGTLPITINTLEANGVDEVAANVAPSLGTVMGMNACGGMWPVFMIAIAAPMAGLDITDPVTIFMIVIATLISSFGIAGVPGTASFAAISAMTILGIPGDVIAVALGFALPVDSLVDMGRTMTNIFGAASNAVVSSKSVGELDIEKFNSNDNNKTV